jgi:hypothetical protein
LRLLLPFAVALLIFGGAMLVMRPSPTGDEPHYVLEAVSIARDGDVDLTNQYTDPDLVTDVWGNPSLEPHAFRFPGGHGLQSTHAPGLPLLLAPVAAVTTTGLWLRAEIVLIAAIAAALLMALLERVPFGSPRTRWLAWAAVVLSAPIVVYSSALYPEIPAVALMLGASVLLTRPRPGPAALAGATALAALLPWLNVRFLALTLAIAVLAAWRAWPLPRRWVALGAVAGPLLVSGLLFAAAFQHWYGSWSPAAQYQLSDSPRTLSGAYRFGVGALLSPEYGWLPQAPLHLLGVVAIGLLVARVGRSALAGVLAAAFYVVVIAASGVGFPGASFPGRQLVVIVPLVAVPLLIGLATQRTWWWRAAFAVLAAISLALTVRAIDQQALAPAPAPGSLLARYDGAWPDYSGATLQRQVEWVGTPASAHVPAGRAGVLISGRTPLLPPSAYGAVVALRADAPATGRLATITVRDGAGTLLATQDVSAFALPPRIGERRFTLSFHTPRPTRLRLTVTSTGATGLTAAAPVIANRPTATLEGSSGYPGLAATIAWIAALVAIAAALVVLDARSGRRPLNA